MTLDVLFIYPTQRLADEARRRLPEKQQATYYEGPPVGYRAKTVVVFRPTEAMFHASTIAAERFRRALESAERVLVPGGALLEW